MTTMRRISFMALALTLGGGGLQSVGADQVSDASDSPPRFQESSPPPSTPLQSLNSSAGYDWVPSSSIRIHNDQGIRYISGGVAEDEPISSTCVFDAGQGRLLVSGRCEHSGCEWGHDSDLTEN